MDYPRSCGCKGCRTCLLCENEYGIQQKDFYEAFQEQDHVVFCPHCSKLYKGWDVSVVMQQHPIHNDEVGIPFSGVYVELNFITSAEETSLMKGIDEMPWDTSQSGRRKQNFGPKTNFKKMKLALGTFHGFPAFSRFVQEKFTKHHLLETFQTIEQCSLEYDPTKGASIDPHIDDCWVWGERVVTVNCLSDSVLTLSMYKGDRKRYNLPLVESYKTDLLSELIDDDVMESQFSNKIIRVPMPNRSLIVLYGTARYQWEHCVLREDITERRVCIAYREFTPPYLTEEAGSRDEKAETVLRQSKLFWDHNMMNEVIEAN